MSQERARAVEIALGELRRAGGNERGLAARLARTHGAAPGCGHGLSPTPGRSTPPRSARTTRRSGRRRSRNEITWALRFRAVVLVLHGCFTGGERGWWWA